METVAGGSGERACRRGWVRRGTIFSVFSFFFDCLFFFGGLVLVFGLGVGWGFEVDGGGSDGGGKGVICGEVGVGEDLGEGQVSFEFEV